MKNTKMMKKIMGLGLASTMLMSSAVAFADSITATATNSAIYVDGVDTTFDAYLINSNNYFKIRDIAQAVTGSSKQFEVTWDNDKQAIDLVSNASYTSNGSELIAGDGQTRTANVNTAAVYKDGAEVSLEAYVINGSTYFKLRDVCEMFDIVVDWDATTGAITVDTKTMPEGERPPMMEGEMPEGERPAMMEGEMPEGERPPMMEGEMPEGERPAMMEGEMPEGERPAMMEGEMPEGGMPPMMQGEIPTL